MARLLLVVLAALALQCCSALPFEDLSGLENALEPKAEDDPIVYRLPKTYEAISYTITLKPFFKTGDAKEFTFDGSVVMRFKTGPTIAGLDKLVLHSNGLNINHADVQLKRIEGDISVGILNPIVSTPENDFLTFTFASLLTINTEYQLTFSSYTGTIREEMEGFYRSSYEEDGATKWLGTTQFQPVSARKVFPCLDEPGFKAKFTLTIIRSVSMKPSLSNMPINDALTDTSEEGFVSETFYETPKMSTYLLAFIVSEFEDAGKTEAGSDKPFGIWARPGAKSMGEYAFATGPKLVDSMDKYTGVNYYDSDTHMKMDQVAIPDFSAGAMENWGLLTYREAILMFDEKESSAKYRQQISSVMAHEIAHMWFGDLVTTHWWSDTWLNEGFATFFQFVLPDMHEEDMDMSTQFVLAQLQTALLADATLRSAPMTNDKVNSPGQINGHFGTISYNKGGSVLRMIENWIGTKTFKLALTKYLTAMQFQSATPADLFKYLDEAAEEEKSLEDYPGTTVASVMESWTSQAGYPLLYVDIDYEEGKMKLTQSRMVSYGETPTDELYKIPITFATENAANFEDTKPAIVMQEKNTELTKTKGHEWVVFNKQQTGFYRVNYDDHSWMMLTSALSKDSRTDIHTLNRAQIVDDVLNLARENITSYENALNVVQFLSSESDYAPWTAAIAGFNAIRRRFATVPDTLPNLDKHILNLLKTVTTTLGLDEDEGDDHLTKIFRANTLNFACMLGHEECLKDARSKFEALRAAGTPVNPNLREHVYCNGLRSGNASDYQFLWEKFDGENVINEKLVILNALGCTTDEGSLIKFLEETISETPKIRRQDLMTAYNSALGGNDQNVEIVFSFIKSNTAAFVKAYGSSTSSAVNGLISRMKGTQLQRVLVYLRSSENGLSDSVISGGISAVASAGVNFEWATFHKATVDDWLDLKYSGSAAITSSLALIITMLALLFKN